MGTKITDVFSSPLKTKLIMNSAKFIMLATIVVVALLGGASAGDAPTADPNSNDFYVRLGIERNATLREIKKAFRKQVCT